MLTAQDIIQQLSLVPLEGEGGFFRQTFKDSNQIIWERNKGAQTLRTAGTAIYYLITQNQFSALHRLPQTEIIHFYLGSPVEMAQISPEGNLKKLVLGQNLTKGHQLQVVIEKNTWQGTRLLGNEDWALLGATVSPGFEFDDLEVASRDKLISLYPQYKDTILNFTRS